MPWIRADQLRRGSLLLIDRRGIPTVYMVEQVTNYRAQLRISARPVSARGYFWNGRRIFDVAPDALFEMAPKRG